VGRVGGGRGEATGEYRTPDRVRELVERVAGIFAKRRVIKVSHYLRSQMTVAAKMDIPSLWTAAKHCGSELPNLA